MDEHLSWYNGSVWHIVRPYQVYVGRWPVFYGPAILLHILKTIWWRNVVLGIMDQCDSKDRPYKIYVGQWPIFHGPLILPYIIVRLKLFLYSKKWHWPGVFVPLRALALVCSCDLIWELFIICYLDFVYSHAPVASTKAINLPDLPSDLKNLMEKKHRKRTCSIAWGKHLWNKFHVSFSFSMVCFPYVQ